MSAFTLSGLSEEEERSSLLFRDHREPRLEAIGCSYEGGKDERSEMGGGLLTSVHSCMLLIWLRWLRSWNPVNQRSLF